MAVSPPRQPLFPDNPRFLVRVELEDIVGVELATGAGAVAAAHDQEGGAVGNHLWKNNSIRIINNYTKFAESDSKQVSGASV